MAGDPVGDVALPPWAADAADCVAQLAAALESPHVSAHLHLWIDLVFGCASRGAPAERADNVFHYLTYDNMCAGFGLCSGMIYQYEINHWTDLVFGCASRGAAAERADDVIHYIIYDDMCKHALTEPMNPKP